MRQSSGMRLRLLLSRQNSLLSEYVYSRCHHTIPLDRLLTRFLQAGQQAKLGEGRRPRKRQRRIRKQGVSVGGKCSSRLFWDWFAVWREGGALQNQILKPRRGRIKLFPTSKYNFYLLVTRDNVNNFLITHFLIHIHTILDYEQFSFRLLNS